LVIGGTTVSPMITIKPGSQARRASIFSAVIIGVV
jgi:hypothetical protein